MQSVLIRAREIIKDPTYTSQIRDHYEGYGIVSLLGSIAIF